MTIPTETDAEMALRLQREFNSAPVASVTSTKSDNSIPIQASTIVALPRPTSTGSESLLGGEVMMDCTGGGRGGAAVVTVPNGAAGIQVARPQVSERERGGGGRGGMVESGDEEGESILE